MKKVYLFLWILPLCCIFQLQAQIINMNPDPDGEPWLSGGAVAASPGHIGVEFIPSAASLATTLPVSAYNDSRIWFPHIIYQRGNSCVQTAEIWYTFTYELNRRLNKTAGNGETDLTNLYHPLFTYNFLNEGTGTAYTYFGSGLDIVRQNGCPSWDIYDDPSLQDNSKEFKYWMTGYEKYKSGMYNTISDVYTFNFYNYPASLTNLKHWIADHGTGDATGGLAVIGVYTYAWDITGVVPSTSPSSAGKKFIKQLGSSSGHALTIVGYGDNIQTRDINLDGQYTTNIDVNNDGIIDIRDYEIGAFKVANSWGTGWNSQDGGFILLPYYLLYPSNPGLVINYAYTCDAYSSATEIPAPSISVKASVEHPSRNKTMLGIGYSPASNNATPTGLFNYNSFHFQGGAYTMRGVYDGPIEIGLNYGYKYENTDVGKVFLNVTEHDQTGTSDGTINYFSLIDHRWDEDFELYCEQTDVPVVNNGSTVLAIEYQLLPHHQEQVTTNLALQSNRVSRFTTTVTNNAVLTAGNGVRIDMYDSEIRITEGSSLLLEDNVSILAKRGDCRIVIDGNIIAGSNLNFIAEEGASLEFIFNNQSGQVNFVNSTFVRTSLNSYAQTLTISNSTFNQCGTLYSHRGNVTVSNSTLTETGLCLEDQASANNITATVSGCNIYNTSLQTGIEVLNYGRYLIENNSVKAYSYGLQINNSGSGISGNQNINNNNIYECNLAGILAYSTTGSIFDNYIHNNQIGIKLMNNCNIALYGNSSAQLYSQTQRIKNNTGYEVYCSQYSFPWYFRYNAIIDEDNAGNPGDPMLYYDYQSGGKSSLINIRYNCWGSNFDASADLNPSAYFLYSPTWCPPGGIDPPIDEAEDLYLSSVSQFEAGNFVDAKNNLQLLIQQYPESEFAQAAMKELLRVEDYGTSDYSDLKEYYLSDDSIQADTSLAVLSRKLATGCDIKLENWEQTISWYEDKILNPTCLEDSVFAIIDLGYVYFLIENQGLKSTYTGSLGQFKPESRKQFSDHRDFLLSLLPCKKSDDRIEKLNNDTLIPQHGRWLSGMLCQNNNSSVCYEMMKTGMVIVSVIDATGKKILDINQDIKTPGKYDLRFKNENMSHGLYLCILIIDGIVCDTKKLIVVK